ncbi:Aste57867_20940 [Aphanomyces stellatus]|uniref:Aste57867_20940 protein n=1 Tax=Aphanomyces stellatus TaxID=120398 RepID=A0A485LG89_9STRA|nr:hypothetical protein As57867_020872 [Aphanomyces stellatus]VFT97617.1 Aste57867_20940 [Aphanomyces stellatus]
MRPVLESAIAVARWLMHLKLETTTVDDITWTYLDSKSPRACPSHQKPEAEIVVILHGFSSMKESMLRVARPLLKHFRVIMPDLPGHGDTTSTLHSYRAEEQAARLHAFLVHLFGATVKVHILGCSMGGMVSGVFAARFPDAIRSVTLICPAGITMPTKSSLFQIFEDTGENYMRVEKVEDFDRLRTYMSFRQRKLPRFIGKFVVEEADKRREALEELMRDILLDQSVLDSLLEKIAAPCLAIWGDSDQILDPSCLDTIKAKVPPQWLTAKVIKDAGHIVHQECHESVSGFALEFLQALPSSTSDIVVQIPTMYVARWVFGLALETATVDDITWSYLDSHGAEDDDVDAPVVVILHGFSSVKESMLRIARPLLPHFRVLMPDLPGHGHTTSTLFSYRADEQAARLHALLLHILPPSTTIHLLGCSMGGMVAGVFAAQYPDRMASVTLICPAGITMPTKSPMFQAYADTGENHMRIENVQDYERMWTYMSARPRKLPSFVSSLVGGFVVDEANKRRQALEDLMRDILLDQTVLDTKLEQIASPCFVLWGDSDRILDPSCLEIVRAKVPAQWLTTKLVPDAGHVVHHEASDVVSASVAAFLLPTTSTSPT